MSLASNRLPAGCVVGNKYLVIRAVGAGANATVYEAEHREIGHRVAIKVVHAELCDHQEVLDRFRREARICAQIRDRHVGQVYDVGCLAGGAPYMVMEFQDGPPLQQLLDAAPMSMPAVIEIGRQVLAGLAAAHAAGVVHRDVKPENVMVRREGTGEVVLKLIDFGIGKPIVREISDRAVTLAGVVVGSPDYMSPEQLQGQEVDARDDIYAVGVLLYQAITQRVPFYYLRSLGELVAAALRDPIRPPCHLRSDCPLELQAIVFKALAKSRRERFVSAAEMAQALTDVARRYGYPEGSAVWQRSGQAPVRTAPVLAPPTLRWEGEGAMGYAFTSAQVVEPASITRRRAAWRDRLGGLAVLGLAGGALFWVWQVPLDDRPPAHVRAPAAAIAGPNRVDEVPVDEEPAAESLAEPAQEVLAEIPPEAPPVTPLKYARSRRRAAPPAVEPVPEPEVAEPVMLASILANEATAAYLRGQMPRARALYQRAVERSPQHADAWRGLGVVSSRMGQRKDAIRAYERYLNLLPDAPDTARIREALEQLREP